MKAPKKELAQADRDALFEILETRFEKNPHRHPGIAWEEVKAHLLKNPGKLRSLLEMESTGGEPDVVEWNAGAGTCTFFDCSPESPKGRTSLCYDKEALAARKQHKPRDSAMNLAESMGVELLNEAQYRHLQKLGPVDRKTSSWIKTPDDIRELDGALFGDHRFGHTFVYHNGAQSYYAARGFRASLTI
ncbi:hypothetical protein HNR46_002715 [Haloferula luteola]|uniref:DUF4256 domain-containing protein n=1 Tax=Haloferula luteola TaxID=595692 RepID=A0A840VF72_9BACT|nr:DUF4256 domain-containing protein [Haloferula luteola]MBB5352469.1 hypothetical protein [Haloferula luteola]